jgi:hypothetical protein
MKMDAISGLATRAVMLFIDMIDWFLSLAKAGRKWCAVGSVDHVPPLASINRFAPHQRAT